MRSSLLLALILILGVQSGDCSSVFFQPLQPIPQNSAFQKAPSTLSSLNPNDNFTTPISNGYSNLDKIEYSLFGKSYSKQNILTRLSRIEMALFTTTYPNSPSEQRIDNIISNFNQINKYPNISKNTLSRLESKVLNQTFIQNNPEHRIERLEEQMFGAAQSGDLNNRLKALQLAAKTYGKNSLANSPDDFNNDFMTNDSSYTTQNMTTPTRNIARGLGNLLGNFAVGSMTGFTPNINPYGGYNGYNYNNAYGNPYYRQNPIIGNHGLQQGYRDNYGYSNGYKDYGTGATVTILP